MLIVNNAIISDDIIEKHFICDIYHCKGVCCIEGDAGAPLEENEIAIIEDIIDIVKPYMSPQGIETINQYGTFDYDVDGELVTPLINHEECAYVYFEKGIAKCAFEKAYEKKKTKFQKPISCHLYPIRISKYQHYDALNYHQWDLCKVARTKGLEEKITVFDFLKEPLIRKYGIRWYNKAKKEVDAFLKNKQNLTF